MSRMLWKTDEALARQQDPMPLTAAEKIHLPESELGKMTIKGLTDREAEFPRIGELRKGAARSKEDLAKKRPGKDLGPFFRFTSQDDAVARRFAEVYGDRPDDLLVYLPGQTAGENFDAWKEHWVAGGLVHRCDGETCTVWRDDDGQYQHTPKPCPGDCKEAGRFRVILPELKRLAYVTVLTSSKHDILNLASQLQAFQGLRGDLRGIPFRLSRIKRMVSTPAPGNKRVRREKWLVAIEPAQGWVHLQIEASRVAALPQLEGPRESIIDSETGEIIEAEAEPEDDNGWSDEDYQDPFDTAEVVVTEPATNGNGDKQVTIDEFYKRVLKEIPYYNHANHIKATLKQMGYAFYNPANEPAIFEALQTHASEKADEEAE